MLATVVICEVGVPELKHTSFVDAGHCGVGDSSIDCLESILSTVGNSLVIDRCC